MPGTIGALIYGLIGGLFGGLIMAMVIMAMGKKAKATPPGIIAEKFLGDEGKKPLVLFPVMSMWGLIFGAVVANGALSATTVNGLKFALVPWILLNVMMLPMAGAGLFGTKKWNMIPMVSLVMHLLWGLVTVTVFRILVSIVG